MVTKLSQQQLRGMNLQSKTLVKQLDTTKQDTYQKSVEQQKLLEQQKIDLENKIKKYSSSKYKKKSKYKSLVADYEYDLNKVDAQLSDQARTINISREGFEAAKESLEPAKQAYLSQGALRTSGMQALANRKEILKPTRDLSQSEDEFEKEVAEKVPEQAKPEYRESAFREALSAVQSRVDKFAQKLEEWDEIENRRGDLDDDDRQSKKEDRKEYEYWKDYLEKVYGESNLKKGITENTPMNQGAINNLIKEFFSGYADAKIESKIDESRARYDQKQKLKALGIVDDRVYLKGADGKFVSEEEYKKNNPWYKGTESLPTGTNFYSGSKLMQTQNLGNYQQPIIQQENINKDLAVSGYHIETQSGAGFSTKNIETYNDNFGIKNIQPVYSTKTNKEVAIEEISGISKSNKLPAFKNNLQVKSAYTGVDYTNVDNSFAGKVSSFVSDNFLGNTKTDSKNIIKTLVNPFTQTTTLASIALKGTTEQLKEQFPKQSEGFSEKIAYLSERSNRLIGDPLLRVATGQVSLGSGDRYEFVKDGKKVILYGTENVLVNEKKGNLFTEKRMNELLEQGYTLDRSVVEDINLFGNKKEKVYTRENLASGFFDLFSGDKNYPQEKFETMKIKFLPGTKWEKELDTGIQGAYSRNQAFGLFAETLEKKSIEEDIKKSQEAGSIINIANLNRQLEKMNIKETDKDYYDRYQIASIIAGEKTQKGLIKQSEDILNTRLPTLSNYSLASQRTKQLTTDIGVGVALSPLAFVGGVALGAASKAVPFLSKAVNTYFLVSGITQAPEIVSAFKENPLSSMAQTLPWTYFGIGQTMGPRLSYNKAWAETPGFKNKMSSLGTSFYEQQVRLLRDKRGSVIGAGEVTKAVVSSQTPSSLLPDLKSPLFFVKAGEVGNVPTALVKTTKKSGVVRNLFSAEKAVNYFGEAVSQKVLESTFIPLYNKAIKSTSYKKEITPGLIIGPEALKRKTARLIPTVEINKKKYAILTGKESFGGGVEISKRETPIKAVLRETMEESGGLKLKEKDLISLGEIMLQPEETASFYTTDITKKILSSIKKEKLKKQDVLDFIKPSDDVKSIDLISLEKLNKINYKNLKLNRPRSVGFIDELKFKKLRPTELFVASHIDELAKATKMSEGTFSSSQIKTFRNVLSREIGKNRVNLLSDKEVARQYFLSKEINGLPTIETITVPKGKGRDIAVGISSIYPEYSRSKTLEVLEGKKVVKGRYKKEIIPFESEEMTLSGQFKNKQEKLKVSKLKDRAIYNSGIEFAAGDISPRLFGFMERNRIISESASKRGTISGKYVTPSPTNLSKSKGGYRFLSSGYVLGGSESSGISILPRFVSRNIEYGRARINPKITSRMIELMKSGKSKNEIVSTIIKETKGGDFIITPKTLRSEFEGLFTPETKMKYKNTGAIAMEGKFVNIREAKPILNRGKAEKVLKLQEEMYKAEREGNINKKENIAIAIEKETGINPIEYIKQIEEGEIGAKSYESLLGKQAKAITQIKRREYNESELSFKEPSLTFLEPRISIKEKQVTIKEPKIIFKENKLFIKEPSIKIKEPKLVISEPRIPISEPEIIIPEPKLKIPEPRLVTKEPKIIIKEPPIMITKQSFSPITKKETFKTQKIQSYIPQVRRKGKWITLGGGKEFEKSEAIKVGEREALGTLAASFRVVKGKKLIEGIEKRYNPKEDIFRTYSKKGDKKIQLDDMWIQKERRRFDRPSEYKTAQSKRFKNKYSRSVKWL